MHMSSKSRRATFVLPSQLLQEMHYVVDMGKARSVSALVRDALEQKLLELREAELDRCYAEAVCDPAFMADLGRAQEAFWFADHETARMIPG